MALTRKLWIAIGVFIALAVIFTVWGIVAHVTSLCSAIHVRVEGGSMSPRIAPDQIIQVREGPAQCLAGLKHGDVVYFNSDSSRAPLIKAIRGLPGDTFAMRDGNIIINGATSTNSAGEPYQLSPPKAAMIELYANDYHGVIPHDFFLVMGENPAGSIDSSRFGLVARQAIIGKLVN